MGSYEKHFCLGGGGGNRLIASEKLFKVYLVWPIRYRLQDSVRGYIECFHSRGQHLCKSIGTKESVCIRKEFNSHRTGLEHQHGRRFIVLGHQYGRCDVM